MMASPCLAADGFSQKAQKCTENKAHRNKHLRCLVDILNY